jgi:ABC-2 family transporter protein
MSWLTWRQFRAQAIAVYAAVAAAAVVLAITGPRLADLARTNANVFDVLTRTDHNLYFTGIVVLAAAPAVVGAFWGAPLVARELEAGTHLLAWNQSVTRTRWLAVKLGVTTLAAALAIGALTLAVTWWSHPIDGALSSTRGNLPSRITPVAFAMRGITPVAYAVFAVVLGVAVGLVIRRSVPAMAVTLALFIAVQVAVPLWVRPHLSPPTGQTVTFSATKLGSITANGVGEPVSITLTTGSPGDWILSNTTVDRSGAAVAVPSWLIRCLPGPPPPGSAQAQVQVRGGPGDPLAACFDRLNAEGYRQRVVFQPQDHFWRLQWAESAFFLGLSGLLTGFGFWWTRKRLT